MTDGWVVEGLEARVEGFHLGPVDLTVGPGRALAVLGPSGAGKTTLLRTLAGFLPTHRGRILHDGVDLARCPPEGRGLGYVPQGLGLLPHRTVEANVRYPFDARGREDREGRVAALLAQFRLTDLARRYPRRLSGGEQQRVAIARALAADPSLVVWDEPWQGLDVQARFELGSALHELRVSGGVPMIVVTHDPALAFSVADDFLVLRGGRMRDQGDALSLLRGPTDAFSARFVGFENVFEPGELAGGGAEGLRSWLAARAGPEGVAFSAPTFTSAAPAGAPAWRGTVRSSRPGPSGVTVEVVADDLLVALKLPSPVMAAIPRGGDIVSFAIEPTLLLRLGPRGG